MDEPTIRTTIFFLLLFALILFESFFPRRNKRADPLRGPLTNLSLIFFSNILIRLFLPLSAVSFALLVAEKDWAILPTQSLPPFLGALLGFLILDLAIYLQHIVFHKVPLLWRLHRVHHCDTHFDTTTGVRFHPLEIFLSMGWKFFLIFIFGISSTAVLLFEIVLSSTSLFNHANIKIPTSVDKFLRVFTVTPDMHRVHHSIIKEETNSNFGFNLPWWDFLFSTYRKAPRDGHQKMLIGLEEFRNPRDHSLLSLILNPFQ